MVMIKDKEDVVMESNEDQNVEGGGQKNRKT